ncbi:MAG: hypothetical protein AAB116_10725 [Candidatus Poribacteria bacterium]
MKKMTIEEIEKAIEELPTEQQLKLVARICERLSGSDLSLPSSVVAEKKEKKQLSRYMIEYP